MRYHFNTKTEAEYLKKIEVWWLKEHGYFCGWKTGTIEWKNNGSSIGIRVSTMSGRNYVQFHYTQTDNDTGEKEDLDYTVQLTTTECNYGGKRYWFVCPLSVNGVYCGRRVGVLYHYGKYFGCRHCHDLTYSSRNESTGGGKYQALFLAFRSHHKIDELQDKIKRPYYAGKPTKKQRKLEEMYRRLFGSYALLKKNKEI